MRALAVALICAALLWFSQTRDVGEAASVVALLLLLTGLV